MSGVNISDLDDATLKSLGITPKREWKQSFSKEQVRKHALAVLALIKDLTQEQRRRVLDHAGKVNRI